MTCPLCLALNFASEDSLRHLVRWQAIQLDRLTGGAYQEPDFDVAEVAVEVESMRTTMDLLPIVEAILGDEDIARKPARVAAPRLIERLAEAGWHLQATET